MIPAMIDQRAHAAAASDNDDAFFRAGVVFISQSAVTTSFLVSANAIMPGQYSGGMRFLAAHARTLTAGARSSLPTVSKPSETCAAPPRAEISAA